MKVLSGVDGAFLHLETAHTPMHVASLHLFDPPAGGAAHFCVDLRRSLRQRLRLAPVLTRKLASLPLQLANPAWVVDDAIDWKHHLQHLTLPAPGTQAQLEHCVGRLHSTLLDRSRPLWRRAVIDGLASGQLAHYVQVHHALAERHGAKLDDIVLALCGGTLRRYLARHGGIPRKALIATMPISLREAGDTEFRTRATLSLVNLHTNIADPRRRLLSIRDAAGAMKSLARGVRSVIPMDFPTLGVPWLLQALAQLYGRSRWAAVMPPLANVVISNVAGPRQPLYAASARMTDYWPLSIVEHGLGLNITVMRYAGTMGFGFATARCAVPDAGERSAALREAFDELRAAPAAAPPRPPRARNTRQGGARP